MEWLLQWLGSCISKKKQLKSTSQQRTSMRFSLHGGKRKLMQQQHVEYFNNSGARVLVNKHYSGVATSKLFARPTSILLMNDAVIFPRELRILPARKL
jgi:hypothetical protein